MRLLSLESVNVKRLKSVRMKTRKGVNIVRGKNEQGKSSVLDSIEYLFGGVKTHPPKVIREGQREARTIAETEDFIAVRRWWHNDAGIEQTELEVRAKDGNKMKSPQALLDKLFSGTFSATAFQELKPEKQEEVLRRLVGVDTTELDASYQSLFGQRTGINTELKSAKARLAAVVITEQPPPKVDVSALLKRQGEITNAQQWARQVISERDASMRRVKDYEEAVKVAEQALAQAKKRLDVAREQAAKEDNAVDELPPPEKHDEDLAAIRAQLTEATGIAAAWERWLERGKLEKSIADLEDRAARFTQQLEEIDKKKTDMIAAAKFPVTGLGFAAAGVTFKGLPLEQASGAQLLRISVAIGIALNPKLRVMLMHEGSFLDEDSLEMLEEICEAHDMQCFVEIVGNEGPATVVIVDGEVVSRSEA